ncbi:pyridoxal 5'-phosphate synthase [Streptomyces sp. NPDC002018]|uniref:pyridoxine/pyridoxamine 5'-phosphate oxidase n=1 Tax=Streptomyces sp. NPDC002018 TaxID=3364629 RepID=UPI00369EB65E
MHDDDHAHGDSDDSDGNGDNSAGTGAGRPHGHTDRPREDREQEDREQEAFRALLRAQRVWDLERLPVFDPDTAPGEPLALFRRWFTEAARAGQPEPHTMTLATADERGRPDLRTLTLHDADSRGWHFATHATSRKGRHLAARPEAALGFYWPAQARAVRVRGAVHSASREESETDLRVRSTGALASALVGRQSEVLGSVEELARASEAAWERARREPEAPVASWTAYVLVPDEVEFFQGDTRRRHVRLRYRREGDGWVRELLWP